MKVSRIGLGVWQFSGDAWGQISYEQAKTIVQKAFELGVNFSTPRQCMEEGGVRNF